MKKMICYVMIFALVISLYSGESIGYREAKALTIFDSDAFSGSNNRPGRTYYNPTGEMRGVWVCFYDFDKYHLKNKSETQFRLNADKMMKKIRNNGCNTVFFHVRSFDDAVWQSDTFKMSSYIATKRLSYDPLSILVERAHKYKLAFHAWFNPYRVTQKKILNPTLQSTQDRIVKAVNEVIQEYDVDGIQFDDYFFPYSSHKQYKKYKGISKTVKKIYVNNMVKRVRGVIKNFDSNIKFGISPAGNVELCESIGADVKTWMANDGYVDYIIPQIYWSDTYRVGKKNVKMFSKRLKQWKKLRKTPNVKLVIGLGVYKTGIYDSLDRGWKKSSKNIANQIKKTRKAKLNGYSLFAFDNLFLKSSKKEVKNMLKAIAKISLICNPIGFKAGTRRAFKASVWPYVLTQRVTWKSSNKSVAKVTKKGIVVAKKAGVCTITAKNKYTKKKIKLVIQ
ncbi:family 10 glycosylhydrolase [Eubacterium xylanophilum]|uniref:family 10 glycosylhydrolase n=1 Tax=Eubacterium xylanophilum TaxID=39497 RepID=UPI000479DDBE|nr:family 10 glycosylhydrolase [Eubacterium xylanophilum]